MKEVFFNWYLWLTEVGNYLGQPLQALLEMGAPVFVTPLIFGLLGALSPCQLTANLSAFAYASQKPADVRYGLRIAILYTLGKVAAYTLIGGAAVALGAVIQERAPSFIVPYRKALGPVMILAGLYFLGAYPLRFGFGHRIGALLASKDTGTGEVGAFLLGFGFSLSFCPTLFVLFFTWVLPFALRSSVGVVHPALFGVGTALPLLMAVGLLAAGRGVASPFLKTVALRTERPLRRLAGGVFLLAGLHDTLVYWAI